MTGLLRVVIPEGICWYDTKTLNITDTNISKQRPSPQIAEHHTTLRYGNVQHAHRRTLLHLGLFLSSPELRFMLLKHKHAQSDHSI